MSRRATTLATLATAVLWVAVVVWWHVDNPSRSLTTSEPGADMRPEGTARKADDVRIGEFFMAHEGVKQPSASLADAWAGFRGPDRTGIVTHTSPIRLKEGDFETLWTVETGEGHAAPAVWHGRVYVLDYDEHLSSDALRCLNLATGEELWRRWYRVPMKRNHGFSRTIPAVSADGQVVTIGPEGHVMACDATTGNLLWTKDMKKQYGSEVPFWYAGQCPLINGDELILAPAGKDTLMVGIDVKTGKTCWWTPNEAGLKMSHSSVMPMTLGGTRTYVYAGVGGVCGIAAEGEGRGRMLWKTGGWQPSVIAPSPMQIDDHRVLLVAGYGAGGALLEVGRTGTTWTARIADQYKAEQGLSSEQQTPILYGGGMILTILPKNGGGMRERICIYKPTDLHHVVWNSASDERFGLGPYVVIDGKLFVLKESGELYVYQLGKESMTLLRHQTIIPDGADAWGPMAYADGMLLLRDATKIKCLKITDD